MKKHSWREIVNDHTWDHFSIQLYHKLCTMGLFNVYVFPPNNFLLGKQHSYQMLEKCYSDGS